MIADFIGLELLDAVFHPRIPIGPVVHGFFTQLPAAHIHHAVRLKRIPVQMIEKTRKCIGRLVGVFKSLLTDKLIFLYIHADVHIVLHFLLPGAGGGAVRRLCCCMHHQQQHSCQGMDILHHSDFYLLNFRENTVTNKLF